MKKVIRKGNRYVEIKQTMETATAPDNTEKAADIRHLGGGWYQLPDGRKVRKSELEAGE